MYIFIYLVITSPSYGGMSCSISRLCLLLHGFHQTGETSENKSVPFVLIFEETAQPEKCVPVFLLAEE